MSDLHPRSGLILKGAPCLIALSLAVLSAMGCRPAEVSSDSTDSSAWVGAPSVRGQFVWAAYRKSSSASEASPRHRQIWVSGPDYDGMEDNDLRGFLDGRFIYGWNQASQIHSRVGRRKSSARYGETELFRTVERWDGVRLPVDASVHSAELRLTIEKGPDAKCDVLLYPVHKDWNPGNGGTQNDNTSPPRPGEVWWGAAGHETKAWGFPGAGFASERHPNADTPVRALAEAVYDPDRDTLHFSGDALAAYIEGQSRRREALRFLVKVSDAAEDVPNGEIAIYTANVGDARQTEWRPQLELRWSAPGVRAQGGERLHLENGRFFETERLPLQGGRVLAASFEPAASAAGQRPSDTPTIQVRGGRGEEGSAWQSAAHSKEVDWDWAQFRILAARDPHELGQPFRTTYRDTWVTAGTVASRHVDFELTSPSGRIHKVEAAFVDDFTWALEFVPMEIGRWRYRMTEDLLKRPFEGPERAFDVVLTDRAAGAAGLRAMLEALKDQPAKKEDEDIPARAPEFWRLERAILRLETPESWASPEGRERYNLLTEIRILLGGRKVPAKLKLGPLPREPDGSVP